MRLNPFRSGERQSAVDELSRALRTRTDLDSHTRAQIQHIISSRRHAGKHPPQSVRNDIGYGARSIRTSLTGRGDGGGTINTMSQEQIQQERAALAQRAATASPAERREILRRDNQLSAMLANAPAAGPARAAAGEVEVDLYGARQDVEDFDQWYAKLGKPTAVQTEDYTAVKNRMQSLVTVAEGRFDRGHVDAANTVLAQARLERAQVERELQHAVESRYKIKPKDFRAYNRLWQRLTRGGVRLAGATAGAFSATGLTNTVVGTTLTSGISTAAGYIPLVGSMVSPPILAGVALAIGGGMVGSAVARYLGYPIIKTPLSRAATRSAEASRRIHKMTGRESTFSEVEQMLRDNVANRRARVQGMREALDAEYGNVFSRTGRGLWRTLLYGTGGATIAGTYGAYATYKAGDLALSSEAAHETLWHMKEVGVKMNSSVTGWVMYLLSKTGLVGSARP